jgi:hypothetical protein
MITINLDMKPTSKRRTIYSRKGEDLESFIAEVRRRLIPEKITPLSCPFGMDMAFVYECPKNLKDSNPHRKLKTTSPYLINLANTMTQALKGIAFVDTKMLTDLSIRKRYGAPDEKNRIEIKLVPCTTELMHKMRPICAGEPPSERTHARMRQRELNKAEHETKQAEQHKQLSIEREAKKQARREAHRLEQRERDRLAKERSNEKLKKVQEDFRRNKEKRDAELRREKAEREAEERRIKREENVAFHLRLMRESQRWSDARRQRLEEDDDE